MRDVLDGLLGAGTGNSTDALDTIVKHHVAGYISNMEVNPKTVVCKLVSLPCAVLRRIDDSRLENRIAVELGLAAAQPREAGDGGI